MSPETFIESVHRGHRVQFRYYVEKQIVPAMKRLFDLVGADVGAWYRELPPPPREPPTKRLLANPHAATSSKQTVDAYYLSSHCAVCGEMTTGTRVVCAACEDEPATTTATLRARAAEAETRAEHLAATCRTCGGCGGGVGVGSSAAGDGGRGNEAIECRSLDCPVYYERRKTDKESAAAAAHAEAFERSLSW
jgi:DNA polymerase zeta